MKLIAVIMKGHYIDNISLGMLSKHQEGVNKLLTSITK